MVLTVSSNVRKIWPHLTEAQKNARREKFIALTNDVQQARAIYSNKVQAISKKHRWSEHWTSHQLYISSIMRSHGRPTAWNGFVREHLKDINEKLEKGTCWKLAEFIATHWETLLHDFVQLTEAHKSNYVTQLMQERVQKRATTCDQPKAIQCKMSMAFGTMDKEWTSLCASLGIKGFYIAVHGGVRDLSAPKLFFSPKGEKFVCAVLDIEPRRLALKFESFVVLGLADGIGSTSHPQPHPLNKLVSECHRAIQKGLEEVLHDNQVTSTVQMNYDNYERKVVERFGVELISWPTDLLPICNPEHIGGRDQVQKLLNALTTKASYWKKLSKEELRRRIVLNGGCQACGENVYKPHKKCTLQGTEKSPATVAPNTDASDLDDGDGGNMA
ncbi:hypothetical protein SCLCIDRAFT_31822 [Scleroderma citrinum Foug A]|uniref:Uncharacterized protein n=1 Tax=Scleroderma citrinum Foug A TaxID=1036808 RepID=A0A0C2ZLP0_9AGAM|nr:hypothetical protein SCLCIDRAFT_31822 [Scleroderma citrinum Foug A]